MVCVQVTRIDDISQFDKLKVAWDAVYAADPHATIFVSWAWLRGWFEVMPYEWLVVAVQPDHNSSYVAFFALSMHVSSQKNGTNQLSPLRMGGNPLADYTGFVCLPQFEVKAIEAFAARSTTIAMGYIPDGGCF